MYYRYFNPLTMISRQPQPAKPSFNLLFPTMNTVEEAEAYAHSRVPVNSHNELHGILMVMQNTILHQLDSHGLDD